MIFRKIKFSRRLGNNSGLMQPAPNGMLAGSAAASMMPARTALVPSAAGVRGMAFELRLGN
jgi:hypothetical protein